FVEKPDVTREGRGSGRSVPGINLAAAFIDARNEGLLVKGGGHAMAGGFTVLPEKMDEFRDFLRRHVARQAAAHEASVETEIDGIVSVQGLQAELVRMLERDLGPFGTGHPEPVFVLPQVRVCSADVVGDGHVRVLLSDWEGGARVKCIAFRAADTALGQALLKGRGGQFHVAGTLKINEWQGRETVEMHICDAAPAMIGPSAQAVPA
ncbi:MAG: single-stranded-DNA-specific exonuclease RecJ, partial [Alphaproteobacteria bacterium]|nr:single-stranded-DNA-specific exonuclease RecJ [Alphaproteobacteria bacterium]